MKISFEDYWSLDKIKNEEGFVHILWAHTKSKPMSHFGTCQDAGEPPKKMMNAIKDLGLTYKDYHIHSNGHEIDWENYAGGNSCGLDYGYPKCCVEKYSDMCRREDDESYKKKRFRGLDNINDVNTLFDQIKNSGDKDAFDSFWEDLQEHHSKYRPDHDYIRETRGGMNKLVDEGKLPKHVYLLLHTCGPCEENCEKYVEKTEKMYNDLRIFGKEFADKVVESCENGARLRWPYYENVYYENTKG